ncbi:MAG: hypothetical protein CL816_07515 [Coxiellaceae bacterium]|nr:hypothetical protein [Coxiellaceae bacterium]|tara:strand:- start:1914 stop:2567 length:654 start_codon:yes stop_codon:yes gene_type:complete
MRFHISSYILVLLFSSTFNTTTAVEANPYPVKQQINVFGNDVLYPVSAWQESAYRDRSQEKHKGSLYNTYRKQKNRTFILEHIPHNETFTTWSKLSALSASFHPDQKDLNPQIIAYQNKMIFKKSCSFYHYLEIPAKTNSTSGIIITIFCETIKDTDEGEVMVKFITTTANHTTLQIYSEWKGQPFNVWDESTWPVSWSKIMDQVQRYQYITINTDQ